MKTLLILIMFFTASSQVKAQQQHTTDTIVIHAVSPEKQIFKSIAIVQYKQRTHLEFAVRKVQNVRNYRVEAGDDSARLMVIGNLAPGCNTVMPSSFVFPLDGDMMQYRYYRVVQVSMGQDWTPGPVLNRFPRNSYTDRYVNTNSSDATDTLASTVR